MHNTVPGKNWWTIECKMNLTSDIVSRDGFLGGDEVDFRLSLPNVNKVNTEERTIMKSNILRKLGKRIGFGAVLNLRHIKF